MGVAQTKITDLGIATPGGTHVGSKLLPYYRVSTERQGRSGLGLDAQRAAVEGYARTTEGTILRSYQEIESGRKNDRPELARAVADARRSKAIIVVARLDRLARDAHLISGLQRQRVPFVCVDMPDADETMLGVYAYFGQREAKLISARTRDALQAAKARGVILGKPENMSQAGRVKGAARAAVVHREKADEAYSDLAVWLQELRAGGLSLADIARRLHQDGHVTRRGKVWGKQQVARVLARLEATTIGRG
jgi:DNA invertase Pin-like site-specific DNA recombinase